jgi:hypothetical protein
LLTTTNVIAGGNQEGEVDCFKFSTNTGWSAGLVDPESRVRRELYNIKWYGIAKVAILEDKDFGTIAKATQDMKSFHPMLEEVVDYFHGPSYNSYYDRVQ